MIPVVTKACLSAVMCKATQSEPGDFGLEFIERFEEEQPHLSSLVGEFMEGFIARGDDSLDDKAEAVGRSMVVIAIVWKSLSAQIEAEQLESN